MTPLSLCWGSFWALSVPGLPVWKALSMELPPSPLHILLHLTLPALCPFLPDNTSLWKPSKEGNHIFTWGHFKRANLFVFLMALSSATHSLVLLLFSSRSTQLPLPCHVYITFIPFWCVAVKDLVANIRSILIPFIWAWRASVDLPLYDQIQSIQCQSKLIVPWLPRLYYTLIVVQA